MRTLSAALLLMLCACQKAPTEPKNRVTLKRLTGSTFELVPAEGQLPYCLAYTHSTSGVTRQLTMSSGNQSFDCPANEPVGKRTFRVPLEEKNVTVLVLFTDHKIHAGSVAQQLIEAKAPEKLTPLDLRLPGNASIVAIDFEARADSEATVGEMMGVDAGAPAEPAAVPPEKNE